MHFSVSKILIEDEDQDSVSDKELKSFCERVRARFKVTVAPINSREECGIAVANLGNSEARLGRTLDQISDFCESSGFGRVKSESSIIEDLDMLEEEDYSS